MKYLPPTVPATAAFKTEHDPWSLQHTPVPSYRKKKSIAQSPGQIDAVHLDMKFRFLTPLVKHSMQTFVSPANKSMKIEGKKEMSVYYPVH